ncbi:MAG: glycoside hydrolase family 127 protein [Microbacteriaceae bacterium]|nr:glycoside hydrolase family 127 protein [Microbacteriaceae bacterium]
MSSETARLELAARRLLADEYLPARALQYDLHDRWPGDFTGRLLAALLELEATDPELGRRADELADLVAAELAGRTCLGNPAPRGLIDEQQVSGHGWLVSALVVFARKRARPEMLELALRLADNVLLPAINSLPSYPTEPRRESAREESGVLLSDHGSWRLSSDTLCVLIALEGLVAVWEATRAERYAVSIREAAVFFSSLDLEGLGAQLHASLTAARCIASFAVQGGFPRLLDVASEVYDRWSGSARTLDSQTWNWFGRGDTWTEPCAVVDALELANTLWLARKDRRYLEDIEQISRNGLAYAQNPAGGFSLSRIATLENPSLSIHEADAYWCCTMRGSWGLARNSRRGVSITVGDTASPTLLIEQVRPCRIEVEWEGGSRETLLVETSFPHESAVRIQRMSSDGNSSLQLRVEALRYRSAGMASLPPGERAAILEVSALFRRMDLKRGSVSQIGADLLGHPGSSIHLLPVSTRTWSGADVWSLEV